MKKTILLIMFGVICLFIFKVGINASVNVFYGSNTDNMVVRNSDSVKYNAVKITNISGFNPDMGQFNPGFGDKMECKELLGPTLVKFLKTLRIVAQGIGCAIAIANGMITFVPAVTSKDASALQKAFEKFVKLLVILALLLLLPTLIRFIGNLAGFDLSCL